MAEIDLKVRNNTCYKQLDLKVNNTAFDLGLFDEDEAFELAQKLVAAAIELTNEETVNDIVRNY